MIILVGTLGAVFGKILASKGFAGSLILPLAANAFISSLTVFINPHKSLILQSSRNRVFDIEQITLHL